MSLTQRDAELRVSGLNGFLEVINSWLIEPLDILVRFKYSQIWANTHSLLS
jgi:hypothetical protein